MYVCFGIKMLIIFLLRDVFGKSKCCLDPWLSCMFDCIHICVFLFLKNCFKVTSTAPRHLSIPNLPIELFSCFLLQSRPLSIARWINRESFYPLDSSSIATSNYRACFVVDTSGHMLDSCICQNFLKLDTYYLLRITEHLYIGSAQFSLHFPRSLSICSCLFTS